MRLPGESPPPVPSSVMKPPRSCVHATHTLAAVAVWYLAVPPVGPAVRGGTPLGVRGVSVQFRQLDRPGRVARRRVTVRWMGCCGKRRLDRL